MTKQIRTAVIGLGSRGYSMLGLLCGMDDCTVCAVCDSYADRVEAAQTLIEKTCGIRPFGCTDYRDILTRTDVDAVLIMTAWEAHVEIACAALRAKKPVGLEVGGAYTLEDCYTLIREQEATQTPFMFLENCCYGRMEMMVMRMADEGLFGRIMHCEGGYRHDLRTEILFGEENRHYRLRNYLSRNCENYPTHELGPIAQILRINRGNRMLRLTSTASASAGLNDYAFLHPEVNPDFRTRAFAQGDVVTTTILCADGTSIVLTLDTTLSRPYSRGFAVHGTRGMYQEDGNFVFLDRDHGGTDHWDFSPEWGNAKRYLEQYEHPVWEKFLKDGVRGGHGGMDYLVYHDFFTMVRDGTPSPIDVYDAAALMCITPLSEQSIKNGSAPVSIPDFTPQERK